MRKVLVLSVLATAAAGAFAQNGQREMGRVVSTTPVMQQVAVPQQVCGTQAVVTEAPRTGAGAVLGALAGGVVGNAIGHGGGRAAATALGLFGGAVVGDRVEGGGYTQVQNVQNCVTQNSYENRTVGYNVTYEYAGRQYNTQMASDPGQWVPVQVGAVSDGYGTQSGYEQPPAQQPVYGQQAYGNQPVYVQPGVVQSGVVVPYGAPPVVYAPAYAPAYAPGYYRPGYSAPLGVSLNLGYSRGYGGGHWR